ncbi:MAG TPA: helix-turn-helix domain-containing protein, partial [Chthoniobacterales bacterium]|nr:helix-turn-helix domain-containing protein [Chthoniobacterales bacterium]
MAQQIMQQQASAQSIAPSAGAPSSGAPELLSPGQVAQELGVSEGDVLATIESGDLKAKKLGSTYRISRAALNEFLKS